MPTHVFLAAKGGQGTTVTAATAALIAARTDRRTLLIDAAEHQDCHAVLGIPEPADPDHVTEVTTGLDLARSLGTVDPAAYDTIIVDAGQRIDLAHDADTVTLVTRNCYLALRRALALPPVATDVIVVDEPHRALNSDDVAAVLCLPIAAAVRLDPAVARVVDAGLLAARLPQSLENLTAPTPARTS